MFASQTCAPILLSQTAPLVQQGGNKHSFECPSKSKRRVADIKLRPPVGPFGYILTIHYLALPFKLLCSPVQALPALIRFALQTCAPIPLKRAGALVQQWEPQKSCHFSTLFNQIIVIIIYSHILKT